MTNDTRPTWADFVRWAMDHGSHDMSTNDHTYRHVLTEQSARVALSIWGNYGDAGFARKLTEFTAEHGTPVDPPAVPREKLLALVEELGREADEATLGVELWSDDYCVASSCAATLRSAESRLRAILGEPASLPKPERVEPGQRWKIGDSAPLLVVSTQARDEVLKYVEVTFDDGSESDEATMLKIDRCVYLGPAAKQQ